MPEVAAEIVSLRSLGRSPVEAEIVAPIYGGYLVYGWTHILRDTSATARLAREVPLRLFVSHHTFRHAARKAMRRWVADKQWDLATKGGADA